MLFRDVLFNRAMSISSDHNSLCSMLSSTTWAFSRTLSGALISGSVCGTATFNPTTNSCDSAMQQLRYIEDGTLTLGNPSKASSQVVHLPVKQEYLYVNNVLDHCPLTSTTCVGSACRTTSPKQQQLHGSTLGILFPDGRPFLQFHFPHLHGDNDIVDGSSSGGDESPSWLAQVSSLSPETHLNGGSSGIDVWRSDADSHLCVQDLYKCKFYLGYLPSSAVSSTSNATCRNRTMPYVMSMEYVVKGPKKDYTARSVLVRKHSSKLVA